MVFRGSAQQSIVRGAVIIVVMVAVVILTRVTRPANEISSLEGHSEKTVEAYLGAGKWGHLDREDSEAGPHLLDGTGTPSSG